MTISSLQLPKSPWNKLLIKMQDVAMRRLVEIKEDDRLFLQQLGYFMSQEEQLTLKGETVARLILVRNNLDAANQTIHDDMFQLPVTQLVLQALAGIETIKVSQIEATLVMAGMDPCIVNNNIVNFLSALNASKVINYNRKSQTVHFLVSPKSGRAPNHIYIDKSRPYSNDLWIREIIRECRGSILWLDKYFMKEAFEWLWREAEAAKISMIKIVSLKNEKVADKLAVADYEKLKKELAGKGIVIEWRTIDKNQAHDFHDRWILDDNGLAYNIPSVNSIWSGQRSELHRSENYKELTSNFNDYFNKAVPLS